MAETKEKINYSLVVVEKMRIRATICVRIHCCSHLQFTGRRIIGLEFCSISCKQIQFLLPLRLFVHQSRFSFFCPSTFLCRCELNLSSIQYMYSEWSKWISPMPLQAICLCLCTQSYIHWPMAGGVCLLIQHIGVSYISNRFTISIRFDGDNIIH